MFGKKCDLSQIFMSIARNVSVANFGVMSFGDMQLVPCESAKNLGVVLDSSLSFRCHCEDKQLSYS